MKPFRFKTKIEKETVLNISTLEQLKNLFIDKDWEIENDSDISLFNRYVNTLKTLNNTQQDFFLDLSKRFVHIPISLYLNYLITPLQKIRNEDITSNLIFMCCLPEEDLDSIKSSQAVLYQIKGTTLKYKINLKPFFVQNDIRNLSWENIKDSNYKIVLVDDFIGSGKTASAAIEYIMSKFPKIDKERINVLCIVAMEKGIKNLNEKGIKTFASVIEKRGISDFYIEDALKNALEKMVEIELKIKKLKDEYHFGYERSEALVCMERCPNNTFPIYWLTKNISPYER